MGHLEFMVWWALLNTAEKEWNHTACAFVNQLKKTVGAEKSILF
jgi:hypothetical protein